MDKKLTQEQFKEYYAALKNGVDPTTLLANDFSANQMRELRFALQNGLDVTLYAKPDVSAETMKAARKLQGLDIKVDHELLNTYSAEQLKEIGLGHKYGLDVSKYDNPRLSSSQMEKIRLYELAHRILMMIKEKTLSMFNSLLERVPVNVSQPISPETTDEQIGNAIINVLKNANFAKFNTIDDLTAHVTASLNQQEELDIQANVEDAVEEKALVIEEYEIIDTVELYDKNIAFMKQLSTGDFVVTNNYVTQGENLMSWEDEVVVKTADEAKRIYQEKVFDAVKNQQIPPIKPEVNIDTEVSNELKELVRNMDPSDVAKTTNYLSRLEQDCNEPEIKNALLQSDQITFTSLESLAEDTISTAIGKLYAEQSGLQSILVAQNAVDSFDYEKYGQEVINKNNLVLSEDGFYQTSSSFDLHKVESISPVQHNDEVSSNVIELKINSIEDLDNCRKSLKEMAKNFTEGNDVSSLQIKVINQDKIIMSSTLSTDEFRKMNNEATISRVDILDKVLEGTDFTFEDTMELDIPSDAIAM